MKKTPYIIRERLLKRDNTDYSIAKLENFQKKQGKMAKKILFQMDIPLYIYDENEYYDTLVEFIIK